MVQDQQTLGRIMLIGGGEIAKGDTSVIDDELHLRNKKGAEFLFVPTASRDNEAYVKTMTRVFGKRFHVRALLEKDGVRAAKKRLRRRISFTSAVERRNAC